MKTLKTLLRRNKRRVHHIFFNEYHDTDAAVTTITSDAKKACNLYTHDDWICPSVSNDMRVGGKYFARGFDLEAVYDEIVEKRKVHLKLS